VTLRLCRRGISTWWGRFKGRYRLEKPRCRGDSKVSRL